METPSGFKHIDEVEIADLDTRMTADALAFHADLAAAIAARPTNPSYRTLALKGIEQPTAQSVRVEQKGIVSIDSFNGTDLKGDGTVPRLSSHPPEWENDDIAGSFGQQHAALPADRNVLRQLRAILTADRLEVYAAPETLVGLELPELIRAGERLSVVAISAQEDGTLPLRAVLCSEDGRELQTRLMRNLGGGRYDVAFDAVQAGLVMVTIRAATPRRPLDPVTGFCIVWDDVAMLDAPA